MALSGKTGHSPFQLSFLLMGFRPGSLVERSKLEGEEDGLIWAVIKFEVGSMFTSLVQNPLNREVLSVHSQQQSLSLYL